MAILVGPNTYSQAIVFAVTAQDFNIAIIAGSTTEGPANQSGQVQRFALKHTGLVAQAPIYLFTRASGKLGNKGLLADKDYFWKSYPDARHDESAWAKRLPAALQLLFGVD